MLEAPVLPSSPDSPPDSIPDSLDAIRDRLIVQSSDAPVAENPDPLLRRELVYQPFQDMVRSTIQNIAHRDPSEWWSTTYKSLRRIQRRLPDGTYPPEIQEYVGRHISDIIELVKGERQIPVPANPENQQAVIAERANRLIHEVSNIVAIDTAEREPITIQTIPLTDLVQRSETLESGYRFKLGRKHVVDTEMDVFEIYSPSRQEWFAFPIPRLDSMIHKGGFPRVVLKILNNAPIGTIEAELPPNDLDVIAWGEEEEAYKEAQAIGVDIAGVEMVQKKDIARFCRTRDLDLNGCFIGMDGLTYSTDAQEAARTGHIRALPSLRGLYGQSMFFVDGQALHNARDLQRVLKFVSEGKALSFDLTPLNQQVDVGIYGLVLAERFMRKRNSAELLSNMYQLLQKIGQVQEGEHTIYDVLNRLHERYPFFQFRREDLDNVGVARWLMRKLGKQMEIAFKMQNNIPSISNLERRPDDLVPFKVSLNDTRVAEVSSPDTADSNLVSFLDRCDTRTEEYLKAA